MFQEIEFESGINTDDTIKNMLGNNADGSEKCKKKGGVYEMKFNYNSSYIGQTGQKLQARFREHIR